MLKLGKFKTLKQYFTDQKRGIRKLQHYKKKLMSYEQKQIKEPGKQGSYF